MQVVFCCAVFVFLFLSVFGLTLQNYKLADSELLFFLPHFPVSACLLMMHSLTVPYTYF